MAPSSTSPKPISNSGPGLQTLARIQKDTESICKGKSASRESTPIAVQTNPAMAQDKAADLATVFKSDLTAIRDLVTCSICNQLLYEPWTLGCGHTYCYSCLCSWFVPNKRKKTCPECRTKVKQMPAPNFLVKQMVEIFTKRSELMPADESIDQHQKRRVEEIADVEKDKNGPNGLFKGTFPEPRAQVFLDEEDGVQRCPICHHEYEGELNCTNCGTPIEDERYGLSDFSDDDLDVELEGLEAELREDYGHDLMEGHFQGFSPSPRAPVRLNAFHGRLHRFRARDVDASESEDSEQESDLEDSAGSLNDFVENDDDEPPRSMARHRLGRIGRRVEPRGSVVIELSDDDESDDGGQVINRRPRRRPIPISSSPPHRGTDDSNDGSEIGDMHSEADRLRGAGWSPLDHGTDSEPDDDHMPAYQQHVAIGDHDSEEYEDSDTNTETMEDYGGVTDDDDRDSQSETPHFEPPHHGEFPRYGHAVYEHLGNETDEDASDAQSSVMMDRDGDTEMSVSPERRRSVSVSTNPYRQDREQSASTDYNGNDTPRSIREQSIGTNYDGTDTPRSMVYPRGASVDTDGGYNNGWDAPENLGTANQIQDVDGESSDEPIRPPPRRRRPNGNPRVQQYDPRISMIFAEHQQSVRGTQGRPVDLDELDEWAQEDGRRVVEPASRNRRMTAYRVNPPLGRINHRSSPSPSRAQVILSSSSRPYRPARQYVRGSGSGTCD